VHDLLHDLPALRQQLRRQRLLQLDEAAAGESLGVARDTRGKRLPRRQREDALGGDVQRARRGLALRLDLLRHLLGGASGSTSASILFSTTKRARLCVPR
jgi:hypothetical protein